MKRCGLVRRGTGFVFGDEVLSDQLWGWLHNSVNMLMNYTLSACVTYILTKLSQTKKGEKKTGPTINANKITLTFL